MSPAKIPVRSMAFFKRITASVLLANNVPCVDLFARSREFMQLIGKNSACIPMFVPGDIAHFNEQGATIEQSTNLTTWSQRGAGASGTAGAVSLVSQTNQTQAFFPAQRTMRRFGAINCGERELNEMIKMAAMAMAAGLAFSAQAGFLIDASHNNGGFTTINGGVMNTAKIKVWDPAGAETRDIDNWTEWAGVSTNSGDSGVEASGIAFLQTGNACFNLTDYVAQEGDVFAFGFTIPGRADKSFEMALVHKEGSGGAIRQVVPSTLLYANSGPAGASHTNSYTVPAGHAMIGNKVGIGILNPTNYPNIDDVFLAVNEDFSPPPPPPPPRLAGSISNDVFVLNISDLVPGATCTLIEADDLTGVAWRMVDVMAPSAASATWMTNVNRAASGSFFAIGRPHAVDAIRSGIGWFDNNGDPVSAHGACIVKENGRFYLFGEFKSDTGNAFAGFSCYSSPDLYNWTFENVVLPVQASGRLGPDRVGERPKVMKCPSTGEYVMYMHSDSLGYNDQAIGYATCDTIDGTYTFRGPLLKNGSLIPKWDMGTFQDDDGTGYVIAHGGYLYKLSDDYRSVVETTVNGAFGQCEAPAIFKKDGTYYWMGSGLTGWDRNDNYYYTATNIAGPWTYRGFIAPPGTLTWNSQSTFVLPIVGSEATTFMFMGDRWAYPYQRSAATYVWQPLVVESGRISMPRFYESWNIELETGRWYASELPGFRVIENTDTNAIAYSAGWVEAAPADAFQATRSNVSNATFTVEFEGSQIGIYAVGRPDGGFARAEIQDGNGEIVLSRVFDAYCKYPESSLKFLSPVLAQGSYTLTVTVLGEHFAWTLKNGTVTGSAGDYVSVDKIIVKQGETGPNLELRMEPQRAEHSRPGEKDFSGTKFRALNP